MGLTFKTSRNGSYYETKIYRGGSLLYTATGSTEQKARSRASDWAASHGYL